MEVSMDQSCLLLVEDEPNDVFLLQDAFEEARITSRIEVVSDGQQAIEYLSGAARFSDRRKHPLPRLILLDLKLPGKSGLQVLEWVRQQPALRGIVVIIFASSRAPQDVDRAYELGVNSFVVKPLDSERRLQFAHLLKGWWLGFNEFSTMFEVHWSFQAAA